MLDVAIRMPDGSVAVDWQQVGVRSVPPLPVAPALAGLLPGGLRRGSTVGVAGSMSLLFALLGAASEAGAWCALVGFPRLSAEAAAGYGVRLERLALVPTPGTGWTTAVGALLDALDIVAVRPPAKLPPTDMRRLAARARSKDAVLLPYLGRTTQWLGTDVRLEAESGAWDGIGAGDGRLRARRVQVAATGRGMNARPRSAQLWLPGPDGGVAAADSMVAGSLVAGSLVAGSLVAGMTAPPLAVVESA